MTCLLAKSTRQLCMPLLTSSSFTCACSSLLNPLFINFMSFCRLSFSTSSSLRLVFTGSPLARISSTTFSSAVITSRESDSLAVNFQYSCCTFQSLPFVSGGVCSLCSSFCEGRLFGDPTTSFRMLYTASRFALNDQRGKLYDSFKPWVSWFILLSYWPMLADQSFRVPLLMGKGSGEWVDSNRFQSDELLDSQRTCSSSSSSFICSAACSSCMLSTSILVERVFWVSLILLQMWSQWGCLSWFKKRKARLNPNGWSRTITSSISSHFDCRELSCCHFCSQPSSSLSLVAQAAQKRLRSFGVVSLLSCAIHLALYYLRMSWVSNLFFWSMSGECLSRRWALMQTSYGQVPSSLQACILRQQALPQVESSSMELSAASIDSRYCCSLKWQKLMLAQAVFLSAEASSSMQSWQHWTASWQRPVRKNQLPLSFKDIYYNNFIVRQQEPPLQLTLAGPLLFITGNTQSGLVGGYGLPRDNDLCCKAARNRKDDIGWQNV